MTYLGSSLGFINILEKINGARGKYISIICSDFLLLLFENYVETWAQKLLNNPKCKSIVFIDCMCNSGVYQTAEGETVYGTPIRVARILRDAAGQYPGKQRYIYLNDNNPEKIELLKLHLPKECNNFHYSFSDIDANERLKQIGPKLHIKKNLNFFLVKENSWHGEAVK